MFKHGTATWSSVSSFVVVLFWCVGCWLAFIAIVNYKNAADGKSGIAKPIIQTVIASLMVAISRFIPILSDTLNNKAAEFSPQSLLSDIPTTDTMGLGLAFTSVLLFVQMLGTIAIFRGFLMIWKQRTRALVWSCRQELDAHYRWRFSCKHTVDHINSSIHVLSWCRSTFLGL
jgi:hypothetical protein